MKNRWDFLVVQWLNICSPIQWMWVQGTKIPHAMMQLSLSAPTEGSHVLQLRPKAAR